VAYGGAQGHYGIRPDLTCFGKIIGGGLPVGAYGGRRELMEQVAPRGGVYQAGTLSGNPLAMAAGIATLKALQAPGIYEALDANSERLLAGLLEAGRKVGIAVCGKRVGSMLGLYFTDRMVENFEDAKTADLNRFGTYYQLMRERGIYLAPSQFEAAFVSAAHTRAVIDETIDAAESALAAL
jgi:glutamate-1-semialdehyde 2,1-aminomutase